MKKAKILECPFCGRIPSGKRFCSTDRGPAMECDHCGTMGPAALDREFIGTNEDKLNPQAIAKWNQRTFDRDSYRMGIEAAASFVEMFDKHVQHPYRLSDCILCKFNLISKRKLRKNVPDRRTPARRKGERRVEGGPEFVMGSMATSERRKHLRRDGARRRRT